MSGSVILGVDPGLSGAIALLTPGGEFERVDDLPVVRERSLSWIDGARLQGLLMEALRGRSARAIVERVGVMPAQGSVSGYTLGLVVGSLLAILQARQVAIELVTPQTWKRDLGLVNADKQASVDRARLMFPLAPLDRVKDHGRAEALLIAAWGAGRARKAAA
jgi:crossover junction endodeoxyribonuclease RuvC